MPTYQKVGTRTAAGTTFRQRNACPGYVSSPGHSSRFVCNVRWSQDVGKVTLVKVGPRKPTLGDVLAAKLSALEAKYA